MACLGTDTLLELVEGRASAALRARIEEHASRCGDCRRVLSSLAREPSGEESTIAADLPAPAATGDKLAAGDRVGRYVLRERLGAGGMGVVYAAHDPELGRNVAIKVLAPQLGGSDARTMFEERLRREARALAQLAHPNVVAIHDVGRVGERLFIAMELLDAETLAHWCRTARHPPREILERFAEAGRGLAAAHAAGIVHRDVKLENMMLGKDGRVRVVDFGLARTRSEPGEPTPEVAGASASDSDSALTVPGAVMGTPHYMAPEQHRGDEVDARTDQFAFCVALYVALFDAWPFAGDDLASLARSVEAGALQEPPHRRGVPRRVLRALRRGLSPAPAERFPTLDALLVQIAPARRRYWLPLAAPVVAAAAVTALALQRESPQPCAGMAEHLHGVWDAARAQRLVAAIRASGAPFAKRAARTVAARLDDYTARWVAMRTEACTATRVRGDQTEDVMTLRMACLDDRLQELDELAGALATGDRLSAARAVPATYQLADLAGCADVAALRLRTKPPRDPALVASVRTRLAHARALDATGKLRDGLAVVAALAGDVTRAAYRPLEAEAALVEGTLQDDADLLQPAVAALERAVWAAEASGYDRIAAKALVELVRLHGTHARFVEADAARTRAAAALERIGDAPALSADLDYAAGMVAITRGDLDAARAALTRALQFAERPPADEVRLASALLALGQVAIRRRDGTAERYLERARTVEETLYGPDHPDLAAVHLALGSAAYERSEYDAAAQHFERAIAIVEHALGHDSVEVAAALHDLALVRQWQGRADEALALVRDAIAIDAKVLPKADPAAVSHLVSEADILEQLDRHDEALAANEHALAMLHALYGADHQDIADALHGRALIELAAGHADRALADARAALAMLGRVDPAIPVSELHRTLGKIQLARHAPAAAVAELELARDHPMPDGDPSEHALLDAFYGRALIEAQRDRARAVALVTAAYTTLRADDRAGEDAAELATWMRAHGVPVPR